MKPVLVLQFSRDASPDLMHRALNFVEDVAREMQRAGLGAVRDESRFGDGRFFVTLESKRVLGEAQLAVSRLKRRHMLENELVVLRDSTATGSALRGAA